MLRAVEPVTLPDPFLHDASLRGVISVEQASSFYWNDQRIARIALALDEQIRPDLTLVLLQGVDHVSHLLWGTLRPETSVGLPEPQRQSGEAAMRRYYEIADSLVGRLIEPFGSDDLVIVMSDHGFEYLEGKALLPWGGRHVSLDASRGILFMRGPGIEAGGRIEGARMQDITPTILVWLGLEVARDMDGRPLALLEGQVRWRDTYDDLAIERVVSEDPAAEAELLRRLEALGYLEGK
jgi:arylsulfatase A-like enzyme